MFAITVIGLTSFSLILALLLYITYDVMFNYDERQEFPDITTTESYREVPWGKLGFVFLVWLGFLIMFVQVPA